MDVKDRAHERGRGPAFMKRIRDVRMTRAPEAYDRLEHGVFSFKYNPDWVARQSETALSTSHIAAQTNAAISKMIQDVYEGRQRTLDEISRRRENAILDLYDVVDTQTGQSYKVEADANYYWMDLRGRIVGTQTDSRPNLDFRKLIRLP